MKLVAYNFEDGDGDNYIDKANSFFSKIISLRNDLLDSHCMITSSAICDLFQTMSIGFTPSDESVECLSLRGKLWVDEFKIFVDDQLEDKAILIGKNDVIVVEVSGI